MIRPAAKGKNAATAALLLLSLLLAFFLGGCDSGKGSAADSEGGKPHLPDEGDDEPVVEAPMDLDPELTIDPPIIGDGDIQEPLTDLRIDPPEWSVTLVKGQAPSTVQFRLLRDDVLVDAPQWIVQDADLGTIGTDGVFTPHGDVGGTTMVHGYVGDRHVSAPIEVRLVSSENGGVDNGSATSLGGYDGVGGEGPGSAIDDAVRAILDGAAAADPSLDFLYPYDETVFPLGLFSPLLMWTESTSGVVGALRLRLYGDFYEYTGYFGRPAALAPGTPFVRHPIPQDAWRDATRSSRGGVLNLELTFVIGGQARGPITRRFIIASGSLQGTVYYQSYGTALSDNYGSPGVGGPFGAATLAIRPGEAAPRMIAGDEDCRVCHTVSSQGQRLVTQRGSRELTSSYDLLNNNVETLYEREQVLAWIGLAPDGRLGLGNTRPLGLDDLEQTLLYDMETTEPVASPGLSEFVTMASFPAFSHSGNQVVFNFESGPGTAETGPGNGLKLVTMRFDPASNGFSDPAVVYEGGLPPGWPSFSPDENSVVFQTEITRGAHGYFESRSGGEGQLWWANLLTGQSHPLNKLNGEGYLPKRADTRHENDEVLNFEPTVSPIATGGYAWVVFMSRRLYGNLATAQPWESDPRRYDHTQVITPKKLWVAAIDLNLLNEQGLSAALEDPSHPAFYLPGQELYAGNSRGFWVQDPCKEDGLSCESGVECCTGTCQADLQTGEPTCGVKEPGCVEELNRCQTSEDCCDPALQCINSICTQPVPVVVVR